MIEIKLEAEQKELIESKHLEFARKKVLSKLNKLLESGGAGNLAFFQKLRSDFDKIIVGKPNELKEFLGEYKPDMSEADLEKLQRIFNYTAFTKEVYVPRRNSPCGNAYKWGSYELVKALKVAVCPYCNRSFINILESASGRTRPEIDHFYPKSRYPHLALSLYNLVPSCHVCNSSFKGDEDTAEGYLNPYSKGFEELLSFRLNGGSDDISYLINDDLDFGIHLTPSDVLNQGNLDAARKNAELFHLEQLYSDNHKDYAQELIWKKKVYSEEYRQELETLLGGTLSSSDIERFIVGNYTAKEDYGKRVLSKFMSDICKQLELF